MVPVIVDTIITYFAGYRYVSCEDTVRKVEEFLVKVKQ